MKYDLTLFYADRKAGVHMTFEAHSVTEARFEAARIAKEYAAEHYNYETQLNQLTQKEAV